MGECWLVDGELIAVGEGMPPEQGSGMENHDARPPSWSGGQGEVAFEGQLSP